MINPLVAGFLQSTIMSTCAWMATTLPLRPGQGKTQFFVKIVGLLSQSLVTQFATDKSPEEVWEQGPSWHSIKNLFA